MQPFALEACPTHASARTVFLHPPGSDLDERELIARARAGEAGAEREIFDLHVDRVHRLCHRLCGDPDLAQDFTQETFVRAFEKLADFEGRAALSSWLHRIAVNTTMNGMRRVQRTRQRERGVEELEPLAAGPQVSDGMLRRLLHRAIDELGETMRVVFVMYELEGYTHREIADVLGVEEGTSKARLSRARAKLRAALAPTATEEGRS